ncbi:unnamed protein product, partial [Rotaria sp. Silwood2]
LFSTSFHVAYNYLNPHFEGQEHLSFCDIACASTILNTLFPSQKLNQSIIYSYVAKAHMSNGITLAKLSLFFQICGVYSIIRYSDHENFEEQFREDIKKQDNFIIVNYWRQYYINEKDYIHKSGHFALIAGFDQKTDYVLILDPNATRFPHHWLPLKHLVRMMSTYDKMASMPRGYLIITHQNNNKQSDQYRIYL